MTKVIIVGCGIAGPVLALLLQQNGYEPIIYERAKRSSDAGLSLALQSNGLKVLSQIPGLVEQLPGKTIEHNALYSIVPTDVRVLAESADRRGMMGVRRSAFLALLSDTALARGIPIRFETPVVGIEQTGKYARVILSTGETDTAPIVVGCDGLHSSVRIALFGKEKPTFTGLTQTGGITPVAFADQKPTMFNFLGDDLHIVTYPISEKSYSWAITQREPETKETWRAMDEAAQEAVRNGPFSQFPFGAGDLVNKAQKIIKYGLYDRPELKSWHKGRVVLIGDAAHPTSPHLGQGANQAFEDVHHLIRLLVEHHSAGTNNVGPSVATLSAVFTAFETERMERTATMVQGARKAGELRVVAGVEAARARNEQKTTRNDDTPSLGCSSLTADEFTSRIINA
ncbi:hypothetical protein GGX14DRAFT_692993 [Mycena pura]|uniref:FAD-binding domain-containing protein n=1 Tax=Mycena pura TaxID=153505 RepID=A0AAD7E3G3_9AGAR|nr:hypothetical protein GGX14DRAFT_692993 [Mycena pura]